jgi:hypothetical protein
MNLKNIRLIKLVFSGALSVLAYANAYAGRSCDEPKPVQSVTIQKGMAMAEKTYRVLEASGQKVVILARAGQDLTKYGVHYSHLGIAYKQVQNDGTSAWRIAHKLNQCGTSTAAVYKQGLAEFFLDDLWRYEAAWVVSTPKLQEQLLNIVQSKQSIVRLDVAPYSMVSYVWGNKYQQSNQWVLETIAMASDAQIASRAQAQQWLKQNRYEPTTLVIGAMTRLGGRMTSANVAFDDHPSERRFSDKIDTVTVDSMFAWLTRSGLSGSVQVLK